MGRVWYQVTLVPPPLIYSSPPEVWQLHFRERYINLPSFPPPPLNPPSSLHLIYTMIGVYTCSHMWHNDWGMLESPWWWLYFDLVWSPCRWNFIKLPFIIPYHHGNSMASPSELCLYRECSWRRQQNHSHYSFQCCSQWVCRHHSLSGWSDWGCIGMSTKPGKSQVIIT